MILVISPKQVYAVKRLLQEASKKKVSIDVLSVEELKKRKFKVNIAKYRTLYIRNPYSNKGASVLPQVIALAKKFSAAGKRVIDANIADGLLGVGKWADYQKLKKAQLAIPKTQAFKPSVLHYKSYPLVLKWVYGFKAKNVFLVLDKNQLKNILPLHQKKEWLLQEFVKGDYEYKVMTVGYKALPTILRFKTSSTGFGVDFKQYDVISVEAVVLKKDSDSSFSLGRNDMSSVVEIAQLASQVLGRELAKVDILQKGKKFYILEVNRFPGLDNFEELTGYNVASEFLKYLVK